MDLGRLETARRYVDWMRRNNTLSLRDFVLDDLLDDLARDDLARDGFAEESGESTRAPSIGLGGYPTVSRECIRSSIKFDVELPPPASREARKLPDLKRENASFAALLLKHVNERFGGDAPKVYAAAKVSRKTYSAIAGNELRPVSKQTAVQFALALRLGRTDADELIKAAGYAFSPAILEDIIVCACIAAGVYEIDDVNRLIESYGGTPFAAQS